jgi:hypothetical protein
VARVRFYESLLWLRMSQALGAEYSWCGYGDRQPEDRTQSFTPQYCAEHDNQGTDPSVFAPWTEPVPQYHLEGDDGLFGGPFSAGHWLKANGPIERAGSTHVFMTY